MKTSMITLVCMLAAGALSSPVAKREADAVVARAPSVPVSGDVALVNRDLLSDLGDILNQLPVLNSLADLTGASSLSVVPSLITQIVDIVKNVESTLANSNGQGIQELLPGITQQLTILKKTIAGLQSATAGISGTLYDVVNGLGLQTLLARVFSGISQLFTQLNNEIPADTPGASELFELLRQITQSLGSVSDLSPLKSSS
ncbi:hypothetical protein DL546_002344 [Coniochaeta pulveracea]|uniref:Uncharacterized protein n=1 Tax=Coniochaeta pulveracea TaxID=177199 RepID=A0A420XX04_9PEZI|nr:hypothetical protein DL546_002344 [Coniochaeta pulveracea]